METLRISPWPKESIIEPIPMERRCTQVQHDMGATKHHAPQRERDGQVSSPLFILLWGGLKT